MSLTFGFYNSLNGDRKYDAVQFGQIFDGIINDGVFMSIGGKLMVTASTGMKVSVATGRAWFDSTWTYNDAIMPLDIPASEVLLDRIDAVVLEVDATETVRMNSIKVVKGTPASNPIAPELSNSGKIYQHPLAHVYVAAGVSSISQSNITNKVGTSECPFVTGILETMDIDDLIAQWGTQWSEFMDVSETEFNGNITDWTEEWNDTLSEWTSQWDTYSTTKTAEFEAWFNLIKGQLSTDAAGNLQNQIYDLKESIVETTMLASGWTSDKKYSFETAYPFAQYNIYISISDKCTDAQYDAYNGAGLMANATSNVVTAHGDKPTIDIPIVVRVVKK